MTDAVGGEVRLQTGSQAPKKKDSKSLAARGPTALPKNRGTGFEEYYAEPPLAPDEFKDEKELYHPSLPFDRRIESCIQRYRARRRMNNERALLFNRYLSLGGIDCQPRQFNTTAGIHDTEGLTSDDIRTMTATDVIPQTASKYSKYYASGNAYMWTVDFVSVVSGFLSVELRDLGSSSEENLLMGVDVVDNFLRYILIHDVCPEYKDDIIESRTVCDKAKTELMNCRHAQAAMPGQFNIACVKLFYNKPAHKAFNDGLDPLDKIPENCDAEAIFRTTVALQPKLVGNKTVKMAEDVKSIRVLRTREMDLEISGLVLPSEDTVQLYSAAGSPTCRILPAGIVVAKHYSIDEGYANQPRPSAKELASRGNEAFFLDCELMSLLFLGTKLRVVVHELNCDLNFVSTVKNVHPSFYTFLPQELMMEWKEPRDNEREAPSVDNPDAEDETAQNMADEEKD